MGEITTGSIRGYHAHIYFEPGQVDQAGQLRQAMGRVFTCPLGRLHEGPIGPHTKGMFQVSIDLMHFARVVPWLMLNRNELSVLIHPETGDDLSDHTRHALWLGEPQLLDASAFEDTGGN